MANISQNTRLVQALRKGPVSRRKAQSMGIANVRARMTELRQDGYTINTQTYRRGTETVTKYSLAA